MVLNLWLRFNICVDWGLSKTREISPEKVDNQASNCTSNYRSLKGHAEFLDDIESNWYIMYGFLLQSIPFRIDSNYYKKYLELGVSSRQR